ncbi:MAG: T9SS type A sorting domain-containing protein [bacterium]|nr:T9SS type A sorting domain-containing protein [bacterium]
MFSKLSFTTIFIVCLHCAKLDAQVVVPSSCEAGDSIVKKYNKDAARMAVRHAYRVNSTYVDSINVDRALRKRYLGALLAVYNATALTIRDTLIDTLRIHTDLNPELNVLNVKATPTLNWMQQLQSSSNPTSNATVNYLFNRYSMQFNYYLSSLYDMVIFSTDSNVNMQAMANVFMTLPGVISATPEMGYNDLRNITDSLNPNFIELSYSIGWGTCADGCDYRHFWPVKIFSDCSVEYKGPKGTNLFLGFNDQAADALTMRVFTDADTRQLFFEGSALQQEGCWAEILTLQGQVLTKERLTLANPSINIDELANGMYLVKVIANSKETTFKFFRE